MADDHAPPPPSSPSASTTAQANFFRRPSFFRGAKTKTHKQTPSSTLYPPSLNLTPTTTPELDTPPPLPTPDHYPFPARDSTTPQRRTRQASRHSIASSVTDLGASLRRSRSASLRTTTSDGSTARTSSSHKRVPSANTLALTSSPEKTGVVNNTATGNAARPSLSISTFSRGNKQKSSESVKSTTTTKTTTTTEYGYDKSPLSAAAAAVDKHKTTNNMAVPMPLRHAPTQKEILQANQQSNRTLAPAAPIPVPNGANPNLVFQHIHELASKRISTLDYLRKAHEGRIYWFNTLLFSKTDLTRLPSFSSRNQARRATQYLLLGFSLPTILDLNANSPADYLKALNALLVEFEQYQAVHPADGSTPSTLSRARLPQMFKRANMGMGMGMGGKGRRSSSATTGEIPVLTPSNSFSGSDAGSMNNGTGGGGGGGTGPTGLSSMTNDAFSPPANNTDDSLHPNESYTHLQTPSLPFDPDFFSTFATLCDVLIDCYTRILGMLATPESVVVAGGGQPSLVGDLFSKADARVRKILLAGVVREFEDSCRAGVKGEVGGVGKVVLGGLM